MNRQKWLPVFRLMAIAWLLLVYLLPLHAQERGQLKKFEGIFQNQQNKDQYVQFTADSNSLRAKLLWNGGQVQLYPGSDLEFIAKEGERVTIKFVRDPDGSINQMSVGDNGVWKRATDYHPIVKTEISHTPAQLKIYEGLYQLRPGLDRFIQFTEKGNKLILKQHWDGQETPFVPDSAWQFFNRDQLQFTLDFKKDAAGNITQVLAFKRDLWSKVEKTHYGPEEMKAFGGKYQLSVDSDDVIQIRPSGGDLVIKQLWDGKETIVSPLAALYFYNAKENLPFYFSKNSDGAITKASSYESVFVKVN
jgi:hypothetical protein